jgi:formylglycine-generating enzyme required for sulfatase activity
MKQARLLLACVVILAIAASVRARSALADGSLLQRVPLRAAVRVRIQAGWFSMGSEDDDVSSGLRSCLLAFPSEGECNPDMFDDERPAHRVHLHAFDIDGTEVSNAAFRRCVNAGACLPSGSSESDARIGLAEQPAVQLSWEDARSYCRWVSGDLPSEAQWEYAARGDSQRAFPWGQVWNSRLANHGQAESAEGDSDGFRYAAPVDSFPDGKSFFGLRNMAGNVWEYVLDRYGGPYASEQNRIDPSGPRTGTEHVIRGGSWRSPAYALRARFRAHVPDNETRPDVGFRCAYEVALRR